MLEGLFNLLGSIVEAAIPPSNTKLRPILAVLALCALVAIAIQILL